MAKVNVAEFPLDERPRLRPVETIPMAKGDDRSIWLRDPSDLDLPMVSVAHQVSSLLGLLNGRRTIDELTVAFRACGGEVSALDTRTFLRQLDEAGFLEGARARARLAERQRAFRERPVRAAVHAGGAYPDGLAELPQFLAAGYIDPDGPGSVQRSRPRETATPRGVIAPHVDLHRGAPTYSHAYKALAEAKPAELYVVLGTCHAGVDGYFAATRKPYDTPLGAVPTDHAFVERLGHRWGNDLFAGEFSHATEHSVEFQAVYLRSLGLVGDGAAPMVAIMCDSLHQLVMPPHSPRDVALVADFTEALRETMAEDGRRITVIAAVDLAHVGPRFGDAWSVDDTKLAAVEEADLEMLGLVAEGEAEAYFYQVMRDQDARRICGFTPMYLLAELMRERDAGELLRYTQWAAADRSSSVTFASMLFR